MTTGLDPAGFAAARPPEDGETGDLMKRALRRFARSVAVVTAAPDGRGVAMSATAVSEISLSPPAMLVCVNRAAGMHAALRAGAPFCINLLHASQAEISRVCGGGARGEDRFSIGCWEMAAPGVPILVEAQANFLCTHELRTDYGTHTIFIGRVEKVLLRGDIDPLLYVDGEYRRVGKPALA